MLKITVILLCLIVIVVLLKWYYKNKSSISEEDITNKLIKEMDKWIDDTVTAENPVQALINSGYSIGYLRSLHTLVKQNNIIKYIPDIEEKEKIALEVHNKAISDVTTLLTK